MISSWTTRTARWSATHPGPAIAGWLLFVAVAVAVMAAVPTDRVRDSDTWVGQSGQAAAIRRDAGLTDPLTENVLISTRSGRLDRTQAQAVAAEVSTRMTPLPGVASVGTAVFAPDGTAALVPIEFTGDADAADEAVPALMKVTRRIADAHRTVSIAEVGPASIDVGVNDRVGRDLSAGERISLPVTFLILLVAFGALIAAGIPVLLAITSVIAALGLYAPLSYLVPDSGTVANVVLLIGLAVGVDYSLIYLKREREERRRGRSTLDAIGIAARTSGHAVLISGVAVMVAMGGLFFAGDVIFTALAAASILVVAVAVLGSLTVLPALLARIGRWVDRPRVPLLWRVTDPPGAAGISRCLLRPVLRRPGSAALVATAILVALAAPVITMKLRASTIETLPADIAQVQTFQRMQESFPQERPSLYVVVRSDPAASDQVGQALRAVAGRVSSDADFSAPSAAALQVSADRAVSVLDLQTSAARDRSADADALERLRTDLVPQAFASVPGARWYVGGDVAADHDTSARLSGRLPWVIAFVLGLTMLMMLVTFRNVIIALLTTALNILSVGASFGVMTLVFQHTWAESLLHFRSSDFLIDWIPLFCFVVLVGLSMDYHVFVLSRVREGLRAGLPFEVAVERGIGRTASVITSAAAVMVSVFAVFAAMSMLEMKQLGVGLATAILVDATVVRLVLLPATLLLLKRHLGGLGRGPEVRPAVDSAVVPHAESVRV